MLEIKSYAVKYILVQVGNDAFRTQKWVAAKVVHALFRVEELADVLKVCEVELCDLLLGKTHDLMCGVSQKRLVRDK